MPKTYPTLTQDQFDNIIPKLIEVFEQRKIKARSSNYIIAQVPMTAMTKGGIALPDSAAANRNMDVGKNGLGVVISTPVNLNDDPEYNDITPGTYLLYNHSGRYYPSLGAVRMALGIDDFPSDILYVVPDNEIIATVDMEAEVK